MDSANMDADEENSNGQESSGNICILYCVF